MPTQPAANTAPPKERYDFSTVSDRKPPAHVPKGDYLLELKGVRTRVKGGDDRKPKKDQTRFLEQQFEIVDSFDGRNLGGVVYDNVMTNLPNREPGKYMWVLRNRLVNLLGRDIPLGPIDVDWANVIGKRMGVTLDDGDPFERKDAEGNTIMDEKTGRPKKFVNSEIIAEYRAALFQRAGGGVSTPAEVAAADDAETGSDEAPEEDNSDEIAPSEEDEAPVEEEPADDLDPLPLEAI